MLVSKVVKDTCIYADRIHDEHDAQLEPGAKALVSYGVNAGSFSMSSLYFGLAAAVTAFASAGDRPRSATI